MAIVYIAGPMRGIEDYNFPAFDRAAKYLADLGHTVLNPADIDRETGFDPQTLPTDFDWTQIPKTLSLKEIVRRDLNAIQKCAAIYLLTGWQNSKGATAEHAVAVWLGLQVLNEEAGPMLMQRTSPKPKPPREPRRATRPKSIDSDEEYDEAIARLAKAVELGQVTLPEEELNQTANRDNAGKPELSQLHYFRLEALAVHVSAGRAKYPDRNGVPNWTLGGKSDAEYLDAIDRHLGKIVRGQVYDVGDINPVTGVFEPGLETMHLAAIAWNALACLTNNYKQHPVKMPGKGVNV